MWMLDPRCSRHDDSAVVPSETTEPTAQEASTSGAGAFAAISLSLVGAGCVFAFSL